MYIFSYQFKVTGLKLSLIVNNFGLETLNWQLKTINNRLFESSNAFFHPAIILNYI